MRRAASENETFEVGGQARPRARSASVRKARQRREALEHLENRTLLATLPSPTLLAGVGPVTIQGAGTPNDNNSSPQVAIDRYDPSKLVAVWVNNQPANRPKIPAIVETAYSTNGGATWTTFNGAPPINIDPNSSPTSPQPFPDTTDPSVGFDSQNQFYILVDEHSAGYSSGELIFSKYSFSGGVPFNEGQFASNNNIIDEWTSGADAANSPTLSVDDNLASFTDPTTKAVQTDPFSNGLYVSWATIDIAPPNTPSPPFNPNDIRFAASSDGGATFTNSIILNSSQHFGNDRNTAPQMTISQGTPVPAGSNATPTVQGGQVTTIWDDYGTGAPPASPPFSQVTMSRDDTGGTAWVTTSVGGPVRIALATNPVTPEISDFPISVSINDPQFTTLASVTATLNILDTSLNDLSAVLIGPNGQTIDLFREQGNNPNIGIAGANLGQAPDGEYIGTTFDDTAARNVHVGTSPYIGHYTPEVGSMIGPFVGDTPTGNGNATKALNGIWTLQLTNFSTTAMPGPEVINWSLNLTSGALPTGSKVIAQTFVRGAPEGTSFPQSVPSSPVGIGPAPVIASNNTLG